MGRPTGRINNSPETCIHELIPANHYFQWPAKATFTRRKPFIFIAHKHPRLELSKLCNCDCQEYSSIATEAPQPYTSALFLLGLSVLRLFRKLFAGPSPKARQLSCQLPRIKPLQIMIGLSIWDSISFLRRPQFFKRFLIFSTFALTELPLFSGDFLSYPRFIPSNLGPFIYVAIYVAGNLGRNHRTSSLIEVALLISALLIFIEEPNEHFYILNYCL